MTTTAPWVEALAIISVCGVFATLVVTIWGFYSRGRKEGEWRGEIRGDLKSIRSLFESKMENIEKRVDKLESKVFQIPSDKDGHHG